MPIELISALIGFLLTLMVFSYLIGDNPLFRFAIYLFIGVSSGYAAAVIVRSVLIPRLTSFPTGNVSQLIFALIPLLLSVSLLAKFSPRIAWLGNVAMAVLVGVGASVAVGGALIGTLLPQAQAAMNAFDLGAVLGANPLFRLVEGTVMLLGTVLTLASFHFSAGRAPDGTPRRHPILESI